MKICVVTSYSVAVEPRAPRHALAARRAFPEADITLVDLAPEGHPRPPDPESLREAGIERRTIEYPTRRAGAARLLGRRLRRHLSLASFSTLGALSEGVFAERVLGLTATLKRLGADAYVAHNIDALLPAFGAAQGRAAVLFDCMEYYSDMGDSQSPTEARATLVAERRFLPRCSLVLASSDSLADVLARQYGIRRPMASYNVPPLAAALPSRRGDGLNLYWRNSVLGFGQRGLDDALLALQRLPPNVRLFLQGRPDHDGGAMIRSRAAELEIGDRLTLLPPYSTQDAVEKAAHHDVGLCLERQGPRNHELTVSNKMFDYHMAGLAVVSSDMPSLSHVINRSGGGLLYKAGDPASLAAAIEKLHASPQLLRQLQERARCFALKEANLEVELDRLADAMRACLGMGRHAG